MMNKDKFFISGGVSKTGTTWLYHMLKKHSEVQMPVIKELNYFSILDQIGEVSLWQKVFNKQNMIKSTRYQYLKVVFMFFKGNVSISHFIMALKEFVFKWNDDWYRSVFSKDKYSGDLTPHYATLSEKMIEKIQKMNPKTKIIIGLRNPIDRTWSRTKMIFLYGKNEGESIYKIEENVVKEHIYSSYYSKTNNYISIINKWKKYFDDEQILIYYYDELKENPQKLYNKICDFLGIKQVEIENINEVVFEGVKEEIPFKYKEMLIEINSKYIEELVKYYPNKYSLKWLESIRN